MKAAGPIATSTAVVHNGLLKAVSKPSLQCRERATRTDRADEAARVRVCAESEGEALG